jgi:site-specific DNA-methyltransferase (cytosine-N4-specific)
MGDVLDVLATLADESVHMCVTSPPYFGLRDYGTGIWEGGDAECEPWELWSKGNGADKGSGGVFAPPCPSAEESKRMLAEQYAEGRD